MNSENREITIRYQVYWVTDNDGRRLMYNDHLAAQMAEIRFEQERRERENAGTVRPS